MGEEGRGIELERAAVQTSLRRMAFPNLFAPFAFVALLLKL
jgi:hypothetical protein